MVECNVFVFGCEYKALVLLVFIELERKAHGFKGFELVQLLRDTVMYLNCPIKATD
jgi:hypothetical protein